MIPECLPHDAPENVKTVAEQFTLPNDQFILIVPWDPRMLRSKSAHETSLQVLV
jgi:hypothetical protein